MFILNPSQWSGRKVFITGAFGFVGSWLTKELLRIGCEICGYSQSGIGSSPFFSNERNIRVFRGSVTDYDSLKAALLISKADTVFHLAANNNNSGAVSSPLELFDVNIKGTWNLLEACRYLRSIESVVICSSAEAISLENVLNKTECKKRYIELRPYAVSKYSAELISQTFAAIYDVPVMIARMENIYGGGDENLRRLIPSIIRAILHNEAPVLRGDGQLQRDYMYIDDAIAAMVALSEYSRTSKIRGSIFHFGSGRKTSTNEILSLLCRIADVPNDRVYESISLEQERETFNYFGLQEKDMLDWNAETSIEVGLRKTFEWYIQHKN